MKILLTGASGFIGSNLLNQLSIKYGKKNITTTLQNTAINNTLNGKPIEVWGDEYEHMTKLKDS